MLTYRHKVIIGLVVILLVVGVALAIALPLTLGKSSSTTTTASPSPIPPGKARVTTEVANNGPSTTSEVVNSGKIAAAATQGTTTFATPSLMGMKVVSVQLVQDIDPSTGNFVGAPATVYLNPQCGGDLTGGCGISSSDKEEITDFFIFSRDSAGVNAQLNSSPFDIEPGTFKYVQISFCSGSDGTNIDNNIEFLVSGMTGPFSFAQSVCANRATADPPLVISAGDDVKLSLAYDLTDSVTITVGGQSQASSCTARGTDTTNQYCLTVPTFTPTIIGHTVVSPSPSPPA